MSDPNTSVSAKIAASLLLIFLLTALSFFLKWRGRPPTPAPPPTGIVAPQPAALR